MVSITNRSSDDLHEFILKLKFTPYIKKLRRKFGHTEKFPKKKAQHSLEVKPSNNYENICSCLLDNHKKHNTNKKQIKVKT